MIDEILLQVEKPASAFGNEVNMVVKILKMLIIRFAFVSLMYIKVVYEPF